MITLREAATGLLKVVESAIEAEDWKVDGACDPTVEIIRLKNVLAKPNKEWVGLTEEEMTSLRQKSVMDGMRRIVSDFEYIRAIEAKLKEKNT